MSDPKRLTFDLNISGSVVFPVWFETIVAGFSAELKQDVLNEVIADGLADFVAQHEEEHGDSDRKDPLAWLDDPDFGANLGRKTAVQHAQAARARVAAGRVRPAKTVDPQAVVRTRSIFAALDDTAADPFGLGRANSAKLDVIAKGLRADVDDASSLKRLAEALGRHAELLAKTERKVH